MGSVKGDKKNKAKNKLFDYDAEELSIVDRGAVDGENFLILKGENMTTENLKKFEEILKGDLAEEVKIEERLTKIEKIEDSQKASIKAALKLLSANKDIIPPKVFVELATLAGYGSGPESYGEPMDKVCAPEKDKVQKALDSLPEEIRKSVDEQVKVSKEQIQKMNDEITKLKSEASRKEFILKAESFKNLGKPEELGEIMMEISEKAPESFKKLEPIMKAAQERIEKGGLLTEVGSSGTNDNQDTPHEKIQKMAVEKSKAENITVEKAYSLIIQENPKLYDEMNKK